MNEEEFMNQKVSEMTVSELAEAIKIKDRKTYDKMTPITKDYMKTFFEEQKKIIEEEMESKFKPIMNEKGILWCTSLISDFILPFSDKENINRTMRVVIRKIWDGLFSRYEEFGLKPMDITRVAMEIQSRIHTILLMGSNPIDNPFFDDLYGGLNGWGMFKEK